jgi:DNA-binding transcriptional ArsR family regulator
MACDTVNGFFEGNFAGMDLKRWLKVKRAHLDATFAALADPTRRAILAKLASGQASVSELAEPFEMTQPAISKHLKVLERAGLISRERDAQRRPSRLVARPLAEAEWLGSTASSGRVFPAPGCPARLDGGPGIPAKKSKRSGHRKR